MRRDRQQPVAPHTPSLLHWDGADRSLLLFHAFCCVNIEECSDKESYFSGAM